MALLPYAGRTTDDPAVGFAPPTVLPTPTPRSWIQRNLGVGAAAFPGFLDFAAVRELGAASGSGGGIFIV